MTFRFSRSAIVTAGLPVTIAALMSASGLAARAQPAGGKGPAALGSPALARPGVMGAQTIVLPTGERVAVAYAGGRMILSPEGGGPPGPVIGLGMGGRTYAVPAVALPYLGRGLSPGLFDVQALAARESTTRVPVVVSYRARVPALPGVRLTSARAGTARGYLTPGSAQRFGAALARQFARDHARGSYGSDGMFTGGRSVSLASSPAEPGIPAQPHFAMHTLTVTGTNLAGKPDTGDSVIVVNVDNATHQALADVRPFHFYHGSVQFSEPDGHYFAVATYVDVRGGKITGLRADVIPQFTVSGNTTLRTDERAASSKVTMVTPRRADLRFLDFHILRSAKVNGPFGAWPYSIDYFNPSDGTMPVWVSPAARRPTAGRLATITSATLTSPPGPGTPYTYNLSYQSIGTIPPQHRVIPRSSLATVTQKNYLDVRSPGFAAQFTFPPVARQAHVGEWFYLIPVRLPGREIFYDTASPQLAWLYSVIPLQSGAIGMQYDTGRVFRPGQQVTGSVNAYPLHPAALVNTWGKSYPASGGNFLGGFPVSASRSGDELTLSFVPFSDNQPGDLGSGFLPGFGYKTSGSYQVTVNGVQVAGGNAANGGDEVPFWQAAVSPKASVIGFTLEASASPESGKSQLSYRSQTTWSWRSAHEEGTVLPPPYICGDPLLGSPPSRDCAVQPLLTLEYQVARMSLAGVVPPGPEAMRISVGHLPLSKTSPVTRTRVQVSLDGGKTWKTASVTGTAGSYRAQFTAPGGAAPKFVTLRVSATDAAGSAITETIWRAFELASSASGTEQVK